MQRLKTRPQFQVALSGRLLSKTTHFALHSCDLKPLGASQTHANLFPTDDVWLGAMVPKRWAKRAVTRNAIKRQIYTVSASIENSLLQRAHVVRLRAGFDSLGFKSASSMLLKAAVRQELVALFDAAQVCAETTSGRTQQTSPSLL